jgi:hypothetical protein
MAGLLATIPMTAFMEILHRTLPPYERYPLPPRQITSRVAKHMGVRPKMDEGELQASSLLSHVGMGTAMGAIYGACATVLDGPEWEAE